MMAASPHALIRPSAEDNAARDLGFNTCDLHKNTSMPACHKDTDLPAPLNLARTRRFNARKHKGS